MNSQCSKSEQLQDRFTCLQPGVATASLPSPTMLNKQRAKSLTDLALCLCLLASKRHPLRPLGDNCYQPTISPRTDPKCSIVCLTTLNYRRILWAFGNIALTQPTELPEVLVVRPWIDPVTASSVCCPRAQDVILLRGKHVLQIIRQNAARAAPPSAVTATTSQGGTFQRERRPKATRPRMKSFAERMPLVQTVL